MNLFTRLFPPLLFLSILFCFCCTTGPKGNGEGYTGIQAVPQSLPQRDPAATLYYWLQPGYTCVKSTGETIASYRGAIQVGTDTYVQYGDYCQTQPIHSGSPSELELDGNLLGFAKGIYQKERKG